MNKIRIIPTVLYKDNVAVRGKKFNNWRVSGSLLQTIRLYSLREVDELIFLDIGATNQRNINFKLIDEFADECFMPITIGGGIKSLNDIEELFKVGADRVCVNTQAFRDPVFIKNSIKNFGSQSIIVSVDYKIIKSKFYVFICSGSINTNIELKEYLKKLNDIGVKEVMLTSIDHDGMMEGYDLKNISYANLNYDFKVIASGGAGSKKDVLDLILSSKIDALSCSSIFHFTEITPLSLKKFLGENNINIRI